MKKPKNIPQQDWDAVDSPLLDDATLKQMKPVSKAHPGIPARVRGPQKNPTKVPVSIRLSPRVIEYFKRTGDGWQSRMDAALVEYVESHDQT